jgi:hypothetical protein
MGRGNKKKKNIPQRDDYDLKSSLQKLNQKRSLPESETSKDFQIRSENIGGLSGSGIPLYEPTDSGSLILKINESINSRYDKLDQNIKQVDNKISNSNDSLRQEMEGKIDNKLDTKIFLYAVSALVVITLLIYTLSYSNLLSDNTDAKNKIRNIENGLERQSEDIKTIKSDIDKIEDDQNEIKLEQAKANK